ncbi:MAG: hypothetical protein ACFFBP_14220 [Promethearchaeota archaeon]
MVELFPEDYVNGIMSTISLIIPMIITILIFVRYFRFKNKQIIYIGISTFGINWSYSGTVAAFFWLFFTKTSLPEPIYFILPICVYPITLGCWIYLVLDLAKVKKAKLLGLMTFIIVLILDITYIYLAFTQTSLLGEIVEGRNIDVKFYGYAALYSLISLGIVWLGLIIFLRDVFKSVSKELKVRGTLLLVALIIFSLAVSFDSWVDLNIPQLIGVRTFVIISAIISYLGWFLPEPIKRRLMKEKNTKE